MKALLLILSLTAFCPELSAVENPGPELQQERTTSSLKEISLKPLFLFSARGRRDPFTFDLSGTDSFGNNRDFSISALQLEGFIGTRQKRVALFNNIWKGTTFKFRAGHLYTEAGALVEDVSG